MTDIKAIPTIYGGVHFRSRLEARWAAFFDLLAWRWEYEPIDLNGYIPDFIVVIDDTQFLFEIKPILQWPCAVKGCMCGSCDVDERSRLDDAIAKLEASGWCGRALIVGAAFRTPGQLGVPNIGIPVAVGGFHWSDSGTVIIEYRHPCGSEYGLRHDAQPYRPDGAVATLECGGRPFNPTQFWREAGNRVQWQRGQKRARPRREDAVTYKELSTFYQGLLDEWESD